MNDLIIGASVAAAILGWSAMISVIASIVRKEADCKGCTKTDVMKSLADTTACLAGSIALYTTPGVLSIYLSALAIGLVYGLYGLEKKLRLAKEVNLDTDEEDDPNEMSTEERLEMTKVMDKLVEFLNVNHKLEETAVMYGKLDWLTPNEFDKALVWANFDLVNFKEEYYDGDTEVRAYRFIWNGQIYWAVAFSRGQEFWTFYTRDEYMEYRSIANPESNT